MTLAYNTGHQRPRPRLKRRDFLRATHTAAVGLGGILLTRTPPAMAQARELKLLIWCLFVPAADDELGRQLKEFGKQEGIKVRLDRVAHRQSPDIYANQVRDQRGHDMTFMWLGESYLYAKHLMELDDLVATIGSRAGGWMDESLGRGKDDHYRAIPWSFVSFPVAVRTDLVANLGEDLPDTWEDVHRIGKPLKAKGHPVGIPLAHALDSNAILRGIIWSWGGKLVEADGKTVAFHSPETVAAYKFIKALYEDCMEAEVLAWNDRNNNVCLSTGKCSLILNPISAYKSARKDNVLIPGTERPVHQVINHIIPPKGPAGRHMCGIYSAIGIWNWTPVPEAAKAFLNFHFQKEQQERFLTASMGYNQPFLRTFSQHPIYASNPKFYFHPYMWWYTHAPGWPGAPSAATQIIWDKYIIPDTVAECATGKLRAEEAVQKAESQIKLAYKRWA